MWYDISRHPRGTDVSGWMDSVKDEDRETLEKSWQTLIEHRIPISAEFRFKTPWEDRNGNKGDTWVLASAYPEKDDQGGVKSIFGSITNISPQKFAEDLQKRRMEEAVELKRQQENFIDITSHEMRNPLSAILQCADEISSSLSEVQVQMGASPASKEQFNQEFVASLTTNLSEVLDSTIDSAQTITLCAQHQKRIVDDVLTLSKLDSALLLVTPIDVQPAGVVQTALKMFEGELQNADIKLDFRIDQSFTDLGIDWVRLDPSRLLQVLINLTTNAIKFTTTQAQRTIVVSLAASLQRPNEGLSPERPIEGLSSVSYVPTRSSRGKDPTTAPEWGTGGEVFLHFIVQDTGRGLSESEKKLLFLRFSQASPRTHVQYGGSGLGLFICRELVELQGGEIGVASEREKGSTFAFYIKGRRSSAPASGVEVSSPISSRKTSSSRLRVQSAVDAAKASTTLLAAKPLSGTISPSSAKREQPRNLRILIVEDNIVNQKVLAKQLQKMGCTTHMANHGGEAMDQLEDSRYWTGNTPDALDISVILMDLEMPVMDGLTCTRKIRELQSSGYLTKHIPIIAITANARDEQINEARKAGVVCTHVWPIFLRTDSSHRTT